MCGLSNCFELNGGPEMMSKSPVLRIACAVGALVLQVDMDFAPAGLVCRILLETDPPTVRRETVVEFAAD
jgi:hypothetical protein